MSGNPECSEWFISDGHGPCLQKDIIFTEKIKEGQFNIWTQNFTIFAFGRAGDLHMQMFTRDDEMSYCLDLFKTSVTKRY